MDSPGPGIAANLSQYSSTPQQSSYNNGNMNSYSPSPHIHTSTRHISSSSGVDDLRADSDEKAWLEKNNFDLKMKVYYLEENLKKISDSGGGHGAQHQADYTEELRAENTSLRLQVEEKCIEMETRNTLLVKAKTAIETLKHEIGKLRNDKQAQGIHTYIYILNLCITTIVFTLALYLYLSIPISRGHGDSTA
jgi:hypothetical protein